MILDYDKPIDFNNNKSLRRLRRWLSYRMASYIGTIEYKKETDKFFSDPQNRIMGRDYYDACTNLEIVRHWHWAINEIIKFNENVKRN
jgi:hypothetical protein